MTIGRAISARRPAFSLGERSRSAGQRSRGSDSGGAVTVSGGAVTVSGGAVTVSGGAVIGVFTVYVTSAQVRKFSRDLGL